MMNAIIIVAKIAPNPTFVPTANNEKIIKIEGIQQYILDILVVFSIEYKTTIGQIIARIEPNSFPA